MLGLHSCLLLVALWFSAAECTSACTTDQVGVYGDARAGAGGFAELTGVVCNGTCYDEHSRWSTVAKAAGPTVVGSADACRAICAAEALCEIFSYDDGRCYLMRKLPDGTTPAVIDESVNASALVTTCVVSDATSGAVHDYGSMSIDCCASLENATHAMALGGSALSFVDTRFCVIPGCAEALDATMGAGTSGAMCSATSAGAATDCPAGWSAGSGALDRQCYKLSGQSKNTPQECTSACSSDHTQAYPACVESGTEMNQIVSVVPMTSMFWIALYQDETATSSTIGWDNWVPGALGQTCSSTYTNWGPGEPNWYLGTVESCVLAGPVDWSSQIDKWWDAPCQGPLKCLCEISLAPPSPPPPPTLPPVGGVVSSPPAVPPPPPPPPTAMAAGSKVSGPANCSSGWETFPDGLMDEVSAIGMTSSILTAQSNCVRLGEAFGSAEGACGSAELVSIHAPQHVLDKGATAGWWDSAVSSSAVAVPDDWRAYSANECRSRCDAEPLCAGYTLSYGICQLRKSLNCTGVLGKVDLQPDPDALLGGRYTVLAGLRGCTAASAGLVPRSWYDQCDAQRCTSTDLTDATFAGPVLRHASGCFYAITDGPQTFDLLAGQWVVMSGGSNLLLTAMAFANQLTPELLGPKHTGQQTGGTDVLDLVWTKNPDGSISVTRETHLTFAEMGVGSSWGSSASWDPSVAASIKALLQQAPAYSATNTVRLTMVVGQYWSNTKQVLEVVSQADIGGGWETAPVALHAQIMQWYLVCGVYALFFCNRNDINGIGSQAALNSFTAEFEDFKVTAQPLCSTSRFNCFAAPNCYDPGQVTQLTPFVQRMGSLHLANSDWLSLIDFYRIGEMKPEEIIEAHASTFVHMWTLTVMYNAITPLTSNRLPAQGCPQPVSASQSCYGSTYGENCPNCQCTRYTSLAGNSYSNWECANARICEWYRLPNATRELALAAPELGQFDSIYGVGGCTVDIRHAANAEASEDVYSANIDAKPGAEGVLNLIGLGCLVFMIGYEWLVKCAMDKAKKVSDTEGTSGSGKHGSTASSSWWPDVDNSDFPALNGIRIIASFHVALGHLYQAPMLGDVYFASWGFTWVPWFMTLSGYVLTHAELNAYHKKKRTDGKTRHGPLAYLHRRAGSIYPMYVVGLVLSLLTFFIDGRTSRLPEWYELGAQGLLLQSWLPWLTEQTIQTHCWFLSTLVPYWLGFGPLFKYIVIKGMNTAAGALTWLFVLALLPWAYFLVVAASPSIEGEWYQRLTGSVSAPNDLPVIFLKFHPLCYLHVFLFGMALARLRDLSVRPPKKDAAPISEAFGRFCCRTGATLGLVILVLMMFKILPRPNSFKLSARLSILLIPQGLILLGLSPIAEEKEEATPSSSTSSGVTSTSTSASADGASLPMSAGEVAALPSPPPSPSVSTEGIYHHATVHLHPSPPPSPPVAGSTNRLCAKCGYQCTLATSKFCTNCGNPFNVVQTEAVEMMAAADMPTATAAPEVAAAGWQQLNIMVLKPTPTSIMGVDLVDTPTGQVAIAHVYPNFPLYGKVGVGDIVLKVNHATVLPPTRQAVQAALTDAPPGDMIITVERTGGTFTSSSNNGTGGAATAVGSAGETVVVQVFKPLPTTVMGVNCAMAVDGHVTITHVFPGYPMHGVLLVGDAILAINGQPLEQTTTSFVAALKGAPAGTVQLIVRRGSRAGGGSGGAPRLQDYSVEDPFIKLFACAWQCDPLWFLFALAPKWFGSLSYCIYTVHMVFIYALKRWLYTPQHRLEGDFVGFLLITTFLAWLFARFSPTLTGQSFVAWSTKSWTQRPKAALAWALVVTAALCLIGGLVPRESTAGASGGAGGWTSPHVQLPAVVLAEDGLLDMRLNWTSNSYNLNNHSLINPTLLWLPDPAAVASAGGGAMAWEGVTDGTLVLAARVHRRDELQYEGMWTDSPSGATHSVTEMITQWTSDMVIKSLPLFDLTTLSGGIGSAGMMAAIGAMGEGLESASVAPTLEPGSSWGDLCEPKPTYLAANQTLFRKVVTGAEDPKLLSLPEGSIYGDWALAFSSHPPNSIALPKPGQCMQTGYGVTQMYIAANGTAAASPAASSSVAVASRMQCGFTRRHEKNWIPFTRGGQLHFVYSIYPHAVVLVRAADGACTNRWSTSSYAPLSAVASTGQVKMHGSGSAVPYGDDRFLALFHTRSVATSAYTTFAYTFDNTPPFAIRSVSKALPLLGGDLAFASGLAWLPAVDKLIVTYGYADAESRALVMPGSYLNETLFDWCTYNKTAISLEREAVA